jgi:hypothetical protein
MQEEHRYKDGFVSPTEFRWQSQNRTGRNSAMGQRIGISIPTDAVEARLDYVVQLLISCGNEMEQKGFEPVAGPRNKRIF